MKKPLTIMVALVALLLGSLNASPAEQRIKAQRQKVEGFIAAAKGGERIEANEILEALDSAAHALDSAEFALTIRMQTATPAHGALAEMQVESCIKQFARHQSSMRFLAELSPSPKVRAMALGGLEMLTAVANAMRQELRRASAMPYRKAPAARETL